MRPPRKTIVPFTRRQHLMMVSAATILLQLYNEVQDFTLAQEWNSVAENHRRAAARLVEQEVTDNKKLEERLKLGG